MKIIKAIFFFFWGCLTIGFLLLALIQRQDALKSQEYAIEMQSKLLEFSSEMQEEYMRNIELFKNNSVNKNTIDSIILSSKFLITLRDEKVRFEIKDNPKVFMINEKYWIKLNTENINKEKIAVTCNNGKIFKSELEGYDFMFIPNKIGKLKLEIYEREAKIQLYGEIEIDVTSDMNKPTT